MVKRWCVVAIAVVLAACSGESAVAGGADDLPPPLPAGVEFAEPADDAPLAPEFAIELIDGTDVEMVDLWTERPVVVVFTASWCGLCADQLVEVDEVVAEYNDAVALVLIGDDEDAEGMAEYLAESDIRRPVGLVPTETWDTYAVAEPPLVALVGPGGHLLRGWPGGVDVDVLREQLDGVVVSAGEG